MSTLGTKATSWHAVKCHWDQEEEGLGERNLPEGQTLARVTTLGWRDPSRSFPVKKAKALRRAVGESTSHLCDIWQVTVWRRDEEGQRCGQEGIKRFLPAFGGVILPDHNSRALKM